MTSPAEHAATVREAYDPDAKDSTILYANSALDALVALAARADELERELPLRLARIFENEGMQDFFARVAAGYEEYERKIEAVEARADELERERAEIGDLTTQEGRQAQNIRSLYNSRNRERERAERAERQCDDATDLAGKYLGLLADAGEALRAAHDPERWGDFLAAQVDELLGGIDAALGEQPQGEFHSEGLDERGIYGGRSQP